MLLPRTAIAITQHHEPSHINLQSTDYKIKLTLCIPLRKYMHKYALGGVTKPLNFASFIFGRPNVKREKAGWLCERLTKVCKHEKELFIFHETHPSRNTTNKIPV